MSYKKLINELIPEPGHFMVFTGKREQPRPEPRTDDKFLNMFKDPERAKEVYKIFAASHNNAVDLLEEAELLLENSHFARSTALAIMSFEELGKSQIAADFYTGILPEREYKKAFSGHKKTSFASRHATIGSHENVKYGLWLDDRIARELETIRQKALYVAENCELVQSFTQEDAEAIISKVNRHIDFISYAEMINERIGSKGLFR